MSVFDQIEVRWFICMLELISVIYSVIIIGLLIAAALNQVSIFITEASKMQQWQGRKVVAE